MYSYSDFERLFIRYQAEAVPAGETLMKFCIRNKEPYNLFEKWYRDTVLNKSADQQWYGNTSEPFKLQKILSTSREAGGIMLNIMGLNNLYYIRDFHDMRCKYEKVLSIIHQQCNKEPEKGDESDRKRKNISSFTALQG